MMDILKMLEEERSSIESIRSDCTGEERRWYDGIVCGLSIAIGIIETLDMKNNQTKEAMK